MGKLDVSIFRYLPAEDFRLLVAVEMGMRNHELVPLELIASIAGVYRGDALKRLRQLAQHTLVAYESSGRRYHGYRLTNRGYDALSLKALCARNSITSVGNQIGVGKESDVYLATTCIDDNEIPVVIKLHRLGRTSFRKLKEKRDYHGRRHACSWLYLSRLAAVKEYAFLKTLYERNFPVARPIDINRHCIVMGLIDGVQLNHVSEIGDAGQLYNDLMNMIVRLARYGVIHGDFNEFNLMIDTDGRATMIDFPQMVSIDHLNAADYFDRDVNCIRDFFRKRFHYETDVYPVFADIRRKYNIDVEVAASGFTKEMARDLDKVITETLDDDDDSDTDDDQLVVANPIEKDDLDPSSINEMVQKTNRVSTIDQWIDSTTDQLNELCTIEQSADNDGDIEQEHRPPPPVTQRIARSSIASGCSSVASSTIPAETIRKRVLIESGRQRKRQQAKPRIKSRADVIRGDRRNNMAIIREYDNWNENDF